MGAQHLHKHLEVEPVISVSGVTEDLAAIEALVEGMHVGEVARLCSPKEGERLANCELPGSRRHDRPREQP